LTLVLLLAERVADLPVAALRVELALVAPRFLLVERLPPAADDERPEDALRALEAPAADADLPRDFVLFVVFLLPLRERLLLDFPRDFLALVAIDASPRNR